MKNSTPPRKSPSTMRSLPAGERKANSRRNTARNSRRRLKPRNRVKPINRGYTKNGTPTWRCDGCGRMVTSWKMDHRVGSPSKPEKLFWYCHDRCVPKLHYAHIHMFEMERTIRNLKRQLRQASLEVR